MVSALTVPDSQIRLCGSPRGFRRLTIPALKAANAFATLEPRRRFVTRIATSRVRAVMVGYHLDFRLSFQAESSGPRKSWALQTLIFVRPHVWPRERSRCAC